MSTVWNKIDSGLSSIYSNYLQVKEHGAAGVARVHPVVAAGGRLNVTLQYTGDLAEIEALGFQTVSKEAPGLATGAIDLANLELFAAHPGVVKMSFGMARRPTLDMSIPDIKANAVWQRSGQVFSGLTGKGVIVGIIDTGVDIHHPFLRETPPPQTTRILRIWDQGLEPVAGDAQPDPSFLSGTGATTYGVEYDRPKIMAALGGLGNFRHRDCSGHGTHVASIAVGNGSDKFKYVGVAPEAELIIVKNFYLLKHPQIGGSFIDFDKLFRDAVTYILNVAEHVFDNRPVVINYSAGNSQESHDGLSLEEDFLTFRFDGRPRRCFVTVSGNDASTDDAGKVAAPQHARIEFPVGGGTVEIPFYLRDERTNKIEYNFCEGRDETDSLFIDLYYPDGPTEISCALKVPVGPTGFPDGFVPGPALGGKVEHEFGYGRHFTMEHSLEEDILVFTGRGTVRRRKFEVKIDPFEKKHLFDLRYLLRITSPDRLTAHVWCQQPETKYMFLIQDPELPEVIIEDRFQINQPGGAKGVITVAGYDAEAAELPVIFFSSRGPIVDYGGSPPLPDKPDIAAPGFYVDAARSRDAWPRRKKKHVATQAMSGTSMSAPHVTGAAALLLQKKPTLTSTEIAEKLMDQARRPATETPAEAEKRKREVGAGRLNVEDAVTHTT